MSSITAFILVGTNQQSINGINPTHYIALYEDEHPSLSLHKINDNKEIIRIKPNAEKLVDNIYLLIHTFILKADVNLINKMNGKEIHKLYNDRKDNLTYEQIFENIETYDLKVVFNVMMGSSLINQLERIKDYPNDFEVTTPKFRKVYNNKTDKVEYIEF